MWTTLLSLTPYIVGSALVPVQIIIGLMLLNSPDRGLLKAVAYVLGMSATRLLQGLLFGLVLATSTAQSAGKGTVAATLLLVLGILLLIAAYRQWRSDADPDEPPSRWRAMVEEATPLRALGLGIGLPLLGAKLWVFTLGALATIADAELGQPASIVAFLLFIVLAQSLLLLPIVLRAALPERSKPVLEAIGRWLKLHERRIVIAVSLVFGLAFLGAGIRGLGA